MLHGHLLRESPPICNSQDVNFQYDFENKAIDTEICNSKDESSGVIFFRVSLKIFGNHP